MLSYGQLSSVFAPTLWTVFPHFAKVLQDNPHLSNIKKTTKPYFLAVMLPGCSCVFRFCPAQGLLQGSAGSWVTQGKRQRQRLWTPKSWCGSDSPWGGVSWFTSFLSLEGLILCVVLGITWEAQPKTHFWSIPRIWKLCFSKSLSAYTIQKPVSFMHLKTWPKHFQSPTTVLLFSAWSWMKYNWGLDVICREERI